MKNLKSKSVILALVGILFNPVGLRGQEGSNDSIIEPVQPNYTLRLSGGPAFIAIDPGYYFQNELIIDLSRRFGVSFAYGAGNAYAGMKDVQRWYLPGSVPDDDDVNRHQSVLSFSALIHISPIHTKRIRLYAGLGPGLNFYNYSEGSLASYRGINVYKLSNKQTIRMSVGYLLGVDLKIRQHLLAGISYHGIRFTETLHGALITTGYRF